MDALSAPDRLKMEAAAQSERTSCISSRSTKVDTYSSLKKQYYMMKLVTEF